MDSVKYLSLIWEHINYVSDKALNSLIKFYPVLNKNSKLSCNNKLIIYKVMIRPAMLYACQVWSMTSKTNFFKLQIQQNKFLRLAGNFRKFTKISQLHDELKIDYVYNYVKEQSIKYFQKSVNHRESIRNLESVSIRKVKKAWND